MAKKLRLAVPLALAVGLLAPLLLLAAALVQNGGFEGGFHSQSGINGQVPDGWTALNLSGNPEYRSTASRGGWVERIEGTNSLSLLAENFNTEGRPFDAVLYQRITGLTPNTPYSVAGWFLSLWGGSARPKNENAILKRIGIDPTGGTDPTAPSVVWSEWDGADKAWRNLSVAAVPTGSAATVFLQVRHQYAKDHTDAILDGVEFREAPTASLSPLPAFVTDTTVTLTWSGHLPDHLRELGPYALYFDVQRRNTDGTWATVVADLTSTSWALMASEGETVTLRVVPKSYQPPDNTTAWPPWTFYGLPTAPVTTVVDTQPPRLTGPSAPRWATAPFTVTLAGSDATSGIAGYDLQWRTNVEKLWHPWLTATQATSVVFGVGGAPTAVVPETSYLLRGRACDQAGLCSDWQETVVHVATAFLAGTVLDRSGEPVPGARLQIEPYPFFGGVPQPGAWGEFFTGVPTRTITVTLSAPDGGALPPTPLTVSGTLTATWRLPPLIDAVANGHFEAGGSDWGGSGWTITTTAHSGQKALLLLPSARFTQTVAAPLANALLSFAWRGEGLTPGAQISVTVGSLVFSVPVADGPWQYWVSPPITSTGTLPLSFQLQSSGGHLLLDEVALGPAREPPRFLFLPLVNR